MSAPAIVFYIIAIFTLVTGLLAVTTAKIFRSAIWLLFSLIGVAGLYFWLQMEFIAAVQIIVYVGGIVVLIIFSIFLTQQSGKGMQKSSLARNIFSILAVCIGFLLTYLLIQPYSFRSGSSAAQEVSVRNIGMQLLSSTAHGYILPFEVVSILLLAAMIGCIVIAMKVKPEDQ
jgi:NADH-quinone oxidoreductase subunit J